jgi:hypothetical protein
LENSDFGSSRESIEGKGFILFSKTALNEKISICAAAAHDSATIFPYSFQRFMGVFVDTHVK